MSTSNVRLKHCSISCMLTSTVRHLRADACCCNFPEIGGLEHIVQDLRESVIYPLCYPELFTSASGLLGAPKGVLLYGPPGCGKTMLAKALAKESNATFINLHVSTLTDKYYGESNKLVSALFSLARKLQPAIIFIDEIDSFLRERRSNDHETTGMMKAEFMSLWDGLTTGEDYRIVVLGATNRPNDIDTAILRRMPKRFSVRLPTDQQRRNILEIVCRQQQGICLAFILLLLNDSILHAIDVENYQIGSQLRNG